MNALTERFEWLRPLGRGGMGSVHLVRERATGREYALKTVGRVKGDTLLRFKHEFRALQEWHHANFVILHELLGDQGEWHYTMEYVDGLDFASYVRDAVETFARDASVERTATNRVSPTDVTLDAVNVLAGAVNAGASASVPLAAPRPRTMLARAFDEARLRSTFEQLVLSVAALHERGFVHRDLKPANVLVTPTGRVVVIDFGLVLGPGVPGASTDANVAGTVGYMAPEQASASTIGPAADYYAIGAMLFEALTGVLPFDGGTFEVLTAKLSRNAPDPRELVADLPADLATLTVDLLATDPSARPDAASIIGRLGRTSATRPRPGSLARSANDDDAFVGRDAERREVLAAVADAQDTCRLVVVEGAPGTGKSAFLARVARDVEAAHPDALLLRGRCHERESVPYKALDSVLDGLSRWLKRRDGAEIERVLPRGVEALAVAFPVLRRVPAIEARVGSRAPDRNELRVRVPSALRELLGRIARERRVVLLVDDYHFRDEDSAALFDELLLSSDAPPITIVLTRLANTRDERLDGRALPPSTRRLALGPFGRAECEALYRLVRANAAPESPAEIDAVLRETEGHPAFVDHWLRRGTRGEASGASTLDALLRRVVDELGPDERAVLDALTVAGAPVSIDVLADVSGLSHERCDRLVHGLAVERLVRRESIGATARSEVAHVRIREIVLSSLDAERRRRLHDAMARSLEARSGSPDAIAFHWLAIDERTHAAEAAAAAAERAASLLAFDRAARFYELAVNSVPATDPRRRGWKLERAHALAGLGRGADAAAAYRETLPTDDRAETLEIRHRIVDNLLSGGHLADGVREMRALLAELGLRYPRTTLGTIFSIVWLRIRVFFRGYAFVERAASDVPRDLLLLIDACWAVTKALGWIDPMRMQIFHSLGTLLALRAGEPYRLVRVLAIERVLLAVERPNATALHASFEERLGALVERANDAHARGLDELGRGWVAYMLGDFRDVQRTYGRSERIFRDECTGVPWEIMISTSGQLFAMTFTGDYDALLERAEPFANEAHEHGNLYVESSVRANSVAFARIVRGDTLGARRELDATFGLPIDTLPLEFLLRAALDARIDLYEGRPEQAIAKLGALLSVARRSQLDRTRVVRVLLASLDALAVIAAAARGRFPVAAARRRARARLRVLRRTPGPWAKASVSHVEACLAKLEGDVERSRGLLRAAVEEYDAAGMQAHREAMRRALARAEGGRAEEAERWFRERQVHDVEAMCRMLGDGMA